MRRSQLVVVGSADTVPGRVSAINHYIEVTVTCADCGQRMDEYHHYRGSPDGSFVVKCLNPLTPMELLARIAEEE
jgi:hypothetical protein